ARAPAHLPPLSLHDALPIFTPPCSRAVDEIARPAFTRHLAAYGNFGKAGILTAELAVRVVETQFDGSAAHRLAGLRAIENDVLRSEEHTSELQSRFDLVCRL